MTWMDSAPPPVVVRVWALVGSLLRPYQYFTTSVEGESMVNVP